MKIDKVLQKMCRRREIVLRCSAKEEGLFLQPFWQEQSGDRYPVFGSEVEPGLYERKRLIRLAHLARKQQLRLIPDGYGLRDTARLIGFVTKELPRWERFLGSKKIAPWPFLQREYKRWT